ncbi:protein of unknown function [Pararobbsia alpina]
MRSAMHKARRQAGMRWSHSCSECYNYDVDEHAASSIIFSGRYNYGIVAAWHARFHSITNERSIERRRCSGRTAMRRRRYATC